MIAIILTSIDFLTDARISGDHLQRPHAHDYGDVLPGPNDAPMTISLGFGVLFATVIILAIAPSLFLALKDILRLLGVSSGNEEKKAKTAEAAESSPGVPASFLTIKPRPAFPGRPGFLCNENSLQ